MSPAHDPPHDAAVGHGDGAARHSPTRDPSPGRSQQRSPNNARAPAPDREHATRGRKTKASVLVASLNVCGRGHIGRAGDKWNSLNQMMKEKRIGIMALQETHLTHDDVVTIHNLYGRRLRVFASPSDHASSTQGVAFVLNRELVDVSNVSFDILIPGRAARVRLRWHADKYLTLLNVYAPNEPAANASFWRSLARLVMGIPHPDVLLGDFNLVEEAADRLPAKEPDEHAILALRDFTSRLSLSDGWRLTDPHRVEFTFPRAGGPSRSRLDRIYTTDELLTRSYKWDIQTSPVRTDHRLVSVKLSCATAPFIGKGRWSLPTALLHDTTFLRSVITAGESILNSAHASAETGCRTNSSNPQLHLYTFKQRVQDLARTRMKKRIPKVQLAIDSAKRDLSKLQQSPVFQTNQHLQEDASMLLDRIYELERRQLESTQKITATRYALNGERVTQYWSAINRERKPRDIFYALRRPGPPDLPHTYETRSDKMAKLARDYHEAIQQDDVEATSVTRNRDIEHALRDVRVALSAGDAEALEPQTMRDEVEYALQHAGTGRACGLDGLPYEFWATLARAWKASSAHTSPRFDCVELLTLAYRDMEEHGLCPEAHFAEGWMCPLYKKKDRRDISNYRPITLLNSDYKLYTKVVALRLSRVVSSIVHPDQAGFIPGRQITDQTQLCRVITDYAEAVEEDGVIIALDQEKAYDKISHDYLWATLRRFGLPATLIKRVQSLYEDAWTTVIINGEQSSPFRVSRGVRQGDPLSCLLFAIAIEPLACSLRASALRGFQIPGDKDRLVASLFADDTSAFLSKNDSWSGLWDVIQPWCAGSTAHFNAPKTEVIPVGSPAYRAAVLEHRCLSGLHADDDKIPRTVTIAPDGTAVRVLGAWIGNGANQAAIWGPALAKAEAFLERWGKCHPSLRGKRHIVQMGPGGITQYLTVVQGMPASIEKRLTAMIRSFIWEGGSPAVSMDALCRPVEEGGIGLLHIPSRNQAIDLMWAKRYLSLDVHRPRWAFAVDVLLAKAVTKGAGAIRPKAKLNTFLQTWSPASARLPEYLARMMTTAKRWNVSLAAVKLDHDAKAGLPIWYHLGALKKLRSMNNSHLSHCLRDRHGALLVADLLPLPRRACFVAASAGGNDYLPDLCRCRACAADRATGCKGPHRCCRAARELLKLIRPKWDPADVCRQDGLTLTRRRKNANSAARQDGGTLVFDPSLTHRAPIHEAFRVFVDPAVHDKPPAIRQRRGRIVHEETHRVVIVGAPQPKALPGLAFPLDAGFAFSQAPYGLAEYVAPARRSPFPIPGGGEVSAALTATRLTPLDAPLHFVLSSDYLAAALFDHLPQWEDAGWEGICGGTHLKALVNALRRRCAPTTFEAARTAHQWDEVNLARSVRDQYVANGPPSACLPSYDPAFDLSGAKLSSLSQALALRCIRSRVQADQRRPTVATTRAVLESLSTRTNTLIDEASMWRGVQHRDFRRSVTDFTWKALHDAHKIGRFWSKIPGYEGRAECTTCRTLESVEHILLHCTATGQTTVWALARKAWQRRGEQWPRLALEDILGLGAASDCLRTSGPTPAHVARLWRILVSESAHLIWVLRCERVIAHASDDNWQHPTEEVTGRWYAAMNRRLRQDVCATSARFGTLSLSRTTVLKTWSGLLGEEASLPVDWTRANGFLVGIDPYLDRAALAAPR